MRCPYRKKTYHYIAQDDEEFEVCYKDECPLYTEAKYPDGTIIEQCERAEEEKRR